MDLVVQLVFFAIAALMIVAAVMVVTARNIIHSALWLISSFLGFGMLYLLMEAEFLAVVQVLVYVGAVSILVLFAIMLTRQIASDTVQQFNNRWWLSLIIAAALFVAVLAPTLATVEWTTIATVATDTPAAPPIIAGVPALGRAIVQEYLLPFQAIGVLLLISLVGAIVIAYEARERRRRVLTLAERWALRQQEAQAGENGAQSGTDGTDAGDGTSEEQRPEAVSAGAGDGQPEPVRSDISDDDDARIENIRR